MHITGVDAKKRTLIDWKLEDIVNQRQLFLTMLESAVVGRQKISLKYYHRAKISKDDFFTGERSDKIGEGLFNTRYFNIWKTYHFHFVHTEREDQTQSFSYFPLTCLLQGVFIDPDAAISYAKFFYREGDDLQSTDAYKLYLVEQCYGLKHAWESQDIPGILWSLLFLVLLEEEDHATRLALNEIYRILSISPCCLLTISNMMNVCLKLVEAYIASNVEDFKNGAVNELRLVNEYLHQLNDNCRLSF